MEKTRPIAKNVRMLVLVGSVVGTMGAISMPAHAEQASVSDEKAPSAAVEAAVLPPPTVPAEHRPSSSTPTPTLTAIQLEKFAELIGEPQFAVSRNLQADPRLIPYAAAAADVRVERKSTGKIMTIVGFSILGVGAIAGYVIMLEGITQGLNCGDGYYDTCNNTNSDTALTGLLVAVVSVGIGLGIGIPGIVKMARQSEEETEAVNRYQDSVSMRSMRHFSPYGMPYPPTSLGETLGIPILSLSF
jgi:hypothetical protein